MFKGWSDAFSQRIQALLRVMPSEVRAAAGTAACVGFGS